MTHKLGSRVVSIFSFDDDGVEVCRPGDFGYVVHLDPDDSMPTVRFCRTGCSTLVDGDTEVVAVNSRARARA